ncbi:uncharacterized protein LOC130935777 [Arachis stenosperma]|uniref:uncharacterized protein LOC130935777 n=1 Tax=Arachis stenosperma TaxID=217475 RepID=UPI0025ABC94B|nr:uncharacterized protein LOC130935777 [Arachis stenosperma]
MPLWLSSLPADIWVSAILSSVAAATVTAASIFLIYKSHLFPHKENLITLHQEQPKRNTCGKILFVSQIGTSEAFAKRLYEFLASEMHFGNCVYLELVDARNYEPEELPKENIVLLVASNSEHWKLAPECIITSLTYGAEDFGRWIQDNAENFGSGVFVVNACSFSVFGVGSSVSEGGKNLMAKAANRIRDFGQAAKFDAASDFDNWWQGVVAVLKGAVLGDTVADDECEQSEPEFQDHAGCCDPKRIYILVENLGDGDSTTSRRRMLTISEANFMKNGTVDLEDVGLVTAQWRLPDGATSKSGLPFFEGFCSLGLSLFFAGGDLDHIERGWKQLASGEDTKLWCLEYDGSAWIWSLCRSMFFPCSTACPMVIPYDGKLCIIQGRRIWVDIYHPKSEFWEKREVPESVHLWPHSCFFWETLIVYSVDHENQWLMSYDLNANIWSPIECNFPHYRGCRKLIRLGCSGYLLIIDFITNWYIYDLSKKKLVAIVHMNELDEIGTVTDVFCCHHTSKESLIYVFIDPDKMHLEEMDIEKESFTYHINIIPYAKVKLQTDGNFFAKVESKGNLKVGPYWKYNVFGAVDQDIKGKTTVA